MFAKRFEAQWEFEKSRSDFADERPMIEWDLWFMRLKPIQNTGYQR
jgi:hypothetical protein